MRISGLMYLFEQLHCALWLLLALGLAAGQVRPEPLRLLCTALFLGALTLACALLPFPWLRFAALALSAVLAPQAAWPGLPRSSLLRLRVTCAALLLASAGSARLLAGMGLSGAPLALLTGLGDPARLLTAQIFWNCTLWPLALWAFRASRERMVSYGG